MGKPYTNAVEKLDYIILKNDEREWPLGPNLEIKAIAEALKKMIEVLDGMIRDPKFITMTGIEALRQLIEVRVMPMTEDKPEKNSNGTF